MRPKPLTYILATLILLLLFAPAPTYAIGMAKLVIKVVDEERRPMEGARVSLYFQSGGLEKDRTVGLTDKEGVFSASGFSSNGITGGGVNKEGYYQSVVHHDFYQKKFGMWQPWGKELTVIIRPIVNPVPMYVRNHYFNFPILDKEVGFDLEKADWVIPYGQGIRSDFIFKVERRYDNRENYEAIMTLTFANQHDGIQLYKEDSGGDFNVGSRFRLPRMAPELGYQPKLQKRVSAGSYGYHYRDNRDENNYIFRLRSEVDKDGKLIRAMYGKVREDFKFDAFVGRGSGKEGFGTVGMLYYLNPDYTKNLEFDPKRNLFISLPKDEGTGLP